MKRLYIYSVLLASALSYTANTQAQEKGTEDNPYTVAEVQALSTEEFPEDKVWVGGYVVGAMDNQGAGSMKLIEWQIAIGRHVVAVNTNIILADNPFITEDHLPVDGDLAQIIPVQLPDNSVRESLNLINHPEVMSGYVLVYGNIGTYFSTNGVRNTTETNIEHLPTGIDEYQSSKFSVKIKSNTLTINAEKASTFSVFTPDGKLRQTGNVNTGENTIELSSGFFVVRVDNKSYKIVL